MAQSTTLSRKQKRCAKPETLKKLERDSLAVRQADKKTLSAVEAAKSNAKKTWGREKFRAPLPGKK